MVPRAFQSFSANCVMADFTGLNLTKGEALSLISEIYQGVEGVKFIQQGKLVEIAFESREALVTGVGKELQVGEAVVPVTRCFSPKQNVVPIAIHGIPIYPKEDTYKEIVEVFSSFGKVQEMKFHCYQLTNIRMDSCSVILDRTDKDKAGNELPRRLDIFGKPCDLFWREAQPFCRYCKLEGHYVQKCPKLEKKKTEEVRQMMSRSREVGVVHGGSVESVHAPVVVREVGAVHRGSVESVHALIEVSKGADKPGTGDQTQVSDMGIDEQEFSQARFFVERGKSPVDESHRMLNLVLPDLSSMRGDEPMLEQAHDCVERGRNVIKGNATGEEVGKVSKELGAKRRRLIRIETSSEASEDQSAREFLACTPTRKGESYLSLMSQLDSVREDIMESGMSDFDEDMEGDGEDLYITGSIQENGEGLVKAQQVVGQMDNKVSYNSRSIVSLSGEVIESEDLSSFL